MSDELKPDTSAIDQFRALVLKTAVPDAPADTSAAPDAPASGEGEKKPVLFVGTGPRREINDEENGRVFHEMFYDIAKYVARKKTWIRWHGASGIWKFDELSTAMKMTWAVTNHIEKRILETQYMEEGVRTEDLKKLAAMRNTAKMNSLLTVAEVQCAIDLDALDSHPYMLNCVNGVLDLECGKLIPHGDATRGMLITKQCPVRYNPDAKSDEWEKFLDTALQGDAELIRYVQKAAGYSLTGDTKEEIFFFIHGGGGTGKSTFIEAFGSILSDYHRTSQFESFLAGKSKQGNQASEDMVRLKGARMVSAVETNEGRRLDVGLVKMLTGRDRITARDLYEKSIQFSPEFKLWLVANHPPYVPDSDDAIWRRLREIPFTYVVPPDKRDTGLKDRLKDIEKTGEAILAWAVRGCTLWQKEGLNPPAAVIKATEAYKAKMDPLSPFFEELCVLHPEARYRVENLYPAYIMWAEKNHIRKWDLLSLTKFTERLTTRGITRKEIAGTVFFIGIGPRTNEAEPAPPAEDSQFKF